MAGRTCLGLRLLPFSSLSLHCALKFCFSKSLQKLLVKYSPNSGILSSKISRELHEGILMILAKYCSFFINAYIVGTHLNYFDMSRQFK